MKKWNETIMNLKGSKTEKNLEIALQGEALAHMKYQFYRSSISNYSKEYEQILDEIVHNEKEHSITNRTINSINGVININNNANLENEKEE